MTTYPFQKSLVPKFIYASRSARSADKTSRNCVDRFFLLQVGGFSCFSMCTSLHIVMCFFKKIASPPKPWTADWAPLVRPASPVSVRPTSPKYWGMTLSVHAGCNEPTLPREVLAATKTRQTAKALKAGPGGRPHFWGGIDDFRYF